MHASPNGDANEHRSLLRRGARGTETAVFLLLFFFVYWLVIDPRLVHHSLGILHYYYPFSFHSGWEFLVDHLSELGGPIRYASRGLSQFFQFGWFGSLVTALLAWHLCWSVDTVVRAAGGTQPSALRWLPAVLLLAVYGGYNHPIEALLSLVLGLSAFAAYLRWAPEMVVGRYLMIVVAGAVLFFAAGSGALLFPLLVAVYELLVARRFGLGEATIGFACILPGAAALLCSMEISEAYAGFVVSEPGLLPGSWPLLLAIYLLFPVTLAGTAVFCRHRNRKTNRVPKRKRAPPGWNRAGVLQSPYAPVAIGLTGMALSLWLSFDRVAHGVLAVDYCAENQQWKQALAAADRLPVGFFDVRSQRNITLALYHEGRLGDEMFRYPQRPGVELFRTPDEARDIGSNFQEGRFFLDMGQVNQAEKCYCEALETCGDMPAILEQLAIVNIVKDRPETARIFLHALARHPLESRSEQSMLDRLDEDPKLQADSRISRIRANMVAKDQVSLQTGVEEFLLALLESNPRNRMAFELLMSHYLVIGRPDGVVAHLGELPGLGYARVPTHYQEAAVIYARSNGLPPVIPADQLDPLVLVRAGQFATIVSTSPSPERARQAALAAGFRETYFYYLAFGMFEARQDEE